MERYIQTCETLDAVFLFIVAKPESILASNTVHA
jgi:hypothetical protein